MVFVPAGYSFGAQMYGLDEVRGGSGWGAGTFAAGDGSRQPSKTELDFAEYQVRTRFKLHGVANHYSVPLIGQGLRC